MPDTTAQPSITLPPAALRLLRLIATEDTGNGADFRYLSRGRYCLRNLRGDVYNRRTFLVLGDAKLVYDGDSDETPVHITEAGRAYLAHLDATAKPKKTRAKPTADSPAALRLLKAIGELTEPTLVYILPRRIWRLGKDGSTASVDTWMALAKADQIRLARTDGNGHRVSITAIGQQWLDA